MSTELDTTRIVRSWLRKEEHESAARVLDVVFDRIETTPQRRPAWPAWRTPTMNKFMTIGLAAAAVFVAVILGVQFFGSGGGVGGPDATPSPTAEATESAAAAIPLPDGGPLTAGRYSIGDPFPVIVTFDVPDGSQACSAGNYERGVCLAAAEPVRGAVVSFVAVENVVANPCSEAGLEPAIGPSADELVTAISNLDGFEASEPTDVTVDGYPAMRFTLVAPESSGCELHTWITPERANGVTLQEENILVVVDVPGNRFMISAAYDPRLVTDGERQAIEGIISSVSIDE